MTLSITSTKCQYCGTKLAANTERIFGFVQAVHLIDDHPQEFEVLAEDARTMIEHVDEGLAGADEEHETDPITSAQLENNAKDAEHQSIGDLVQNVLSELVDPPEDDQLGDENEY